MVDGLKARARTAALVSIAAFAAAVVMTWPLAAGIDHLGRTQNSGDGRCLRRVAATQFTHAKG